jgi:hypothetical protein
MIIKLSKNILYTGIVITIVWRLLGLLTGNGYFLSLDIFPPYFFSVVLDTFIFLTNIVLLNEILRQIKQNHSFTILFVFLFFAHLLGRLLTVLPSSSFGIDFSFYWIPMLLYWPVGIIIAIKYFQLEGKLSDLFKIFGAFELLALLGGIFINIAYRFTSVDGAEQIQWVFMGLNFITTFLLCYIFFESSKYLDGKHEDVDNDILDNI